MLLLYAGCILAGILVVLIRYSLWRKQYSKGIPTVTPGFLNIFGHFLDLWTFKDLHLNVMDVFVSRSKQFQNKGIMCLWLSYTPLVFLIKAETVKVVLKSNKMLDKGWMYEWMKPVVGEGLLTSAGEKWKFQKRLLTPCFHADVVRNFMASFNEESRNLVDILREEMKKDFIYIAGKITLCTLDIASETIFGVTLGALKNEDAQYLKSLRKIASIFMARLYCPWLWPDFIFLKSKMGRDMKQSKEDLQNVTRNIIKEKRNRYLKGEKITLKGRRKAMLDLLLEKHFETQELSEEEIGEQVDLFLIAGHETVATTVTWALFLLGHHPEAQAKLHEELDRVFGDDNDRPVTEDDFKDLQYLECVLKETLRLYPGIPIFAREAPEDMIINFENTSLRHLHKWFVSINNKYYEDFSVEEESRTLKQNFDKVSKHIDLNICGEYYVKIYKDWYIKEEDLIIENFILQTKTQQLAVLDDDENDFSMNEDEVCEIKDISETLRYSEETKKDYFFRKELRETCKDGCPISKGTACVVFPYSLHRDEDVFPDPEKFDPDRFSPENIVNIPEFAYVPFSAGPRNCIGYKFAEMELRVILSWIMRNFTVKSLDPKDKAKPILSIGIHSSVPIRIRFSSRSIS